MSLLQTNEYSFTTFLTKTSFSFPPLKEKLSELISTTQKTTTDFFLTDTKNNRIAQPELAHYSSISATSSDSKLLESISLLKNIIDRLGKASSDNQRETSRKHDSSDSSIDNLYLLAKNSVTLSFKDYLQIQKTGNNFLSSTLNPINSTISTTNTVSDYTSPFVYSTKTPSHIIEMIKSIYINSTNVRSELNSNFSSSSKEFSLSTDDTEFFNDPLNTLSLSVTNNSSFLFGIAFFYSFLVITSLTSNPLLIYVLLWRRKAQIKLIDIFVANLSLSDLFLTIFNIPLCLIIYFSEQWPFGSLLCQLGTFSTSCSIYVNIFTMAYISIDRYFAVTRPLISNPNCQLRKKSILLDNHTRHKIYLVLTFIWIIAIGLSLPQILFSKVSSQEKSAYDGAGNRSELAFLDESQTGAEFGEDPFKRCIIEYPYKHMKNIMVLVNFSLQYLIPSIVILYFYGKIIYHLYLNLNVEELMESTTQKHGSNHKQNNKSISSKKTPRSYAESETETDKINKPTTSATQAKITRKKSRMRIEGVNRTRNLKKSIKTMIIIIALFLLSWLPIHIYRMATTFYPILIEYFHSKFNSLSSNNTNINDNLGKSHQTFLNTSISESCRNVTSKECLINALKDLRDLSDSSSISFKINTLHNRYVFFFCYFMAMSSVCYNPIVYFWMHKKFRAEVKVLFSRIFSFFWRRNREETRSESFLDNANNVRSSFQPRSSSKVNFSKTNKFSILTKQSTINTNETERTNVSIQSKNRKILKKPSKKKIAQPCYVSSIKIRNKRFSSLSSESTASSTKRSDFY